MSEYYNDIEFWLALTEELLQSTCEIRLRLHKADEEIERLKAENEKLNVELIHANSPHSSDMDCELVKENTLLKSQLEAVEWRDGKQRADILEFRRLTEAVWNILEEYIDDDMDISFADGIRLVVENLEDRHDILREKLENAEIERDKVFKVFNELNDVCQDLPESFKGMSFPDIIKNIWDEFQALESEKKANMGILEEMEQLIQKTKGWE